MHVLTPFKYKLTEEGALQANPFSHPLTKYKVVLRDSYNQDLYLLRLIHNEPLTYAKLVARASALGVECVPSRLYRLEREQLITRYA